MAETSPSSTDKDAVVTSAEFKRLRRLTRVTLALSALILVLLVAGAIIHHHRMHHRFAGRDGRGGGGCGQCQMGFGPRFHRFGGMGMNQGWGGPRGPAAFGGHGNGGPPPGMPGMGGMNGTTGGPMMMAGPMGKADPAKVTEMAMNHLSEKLALTDDEKAKIKPIVEQQVAEIQKQMEAQRALMQKQIEDAKSKIKPFLTADQQKQLDALPLPGQKPPAPDEASESGAKPGP